MQGPLAYVSVHIFYGCDIELLFYVSQDQQIDALFYKIDWSSDGNITWDEFCTYMQLEYAEKEDSYQR